ncbi:DUF4123 domain-containing protein [Vibrio algivorus]|nr:DUF4123 domain-containing protein [Vibrio algivorus]
MSVQAIEINNLYQRLDSLHHDEHLYLLVDVLSWPEGLAQAQSLDPQVNMVKLFMGTQLSNVMDVSPWVIEINDQSKTLLEQVAEKKIGIVYISTLSLSNFQQSITPLLIASMPAINDKQPHQVLLSFYRPSVAQGIALMNIGLLSFGACIEIWIPAARHQQWQSYTCHQTLPARAILLTPELHQSIDEQYYQYWLGGFGNWQSHSDEDFTKAARIVYLLKQNHVTRELPILMWLDWLQWHIQEIDIETILPIIRQDKPALARLEQVKLLVKDSGDE